MAEWQNPKVLAVVLSIAILFVILLASSIVFFSRLYFKGIISEKEKLSKAKEEHQKSLLRNSILVQERERERIAKELHDDLVSKLTIISIALQTSNQRVNPIELLDHSIKTARNISHELLPPLLKQLSLDELVDGFIEPLSEKYALTRFYGPHHEKAPLSDEIKLQLFRIIQEVSNNIIKHAHATYIDFRIVTSPKYSAILIHDNGVGFARHTESKGLGMKNIELRSQILNATFKFKSPEKGGTTFILALRNDQTKS